MNAPTQAPWLRVLVVDDDAVARRSYQRTLQARGLAVDLAANAEEAMGAIVANDYEVALLDWRLPGEIDGLALARKMRATKAGTGLVMISGYSKHSHRADALERGIDDYIVKPPWPDELVARIRAVARRSRLRPRATVWGPLQVDLLANRVWVSGVEVAGLQSLQVRLLAYLVRNAGRVCTHAELSTEVFGGVAGSRTTSRAQAIWALRARCGASGQLIVTVRGVGYGLGVHQRGAGGSFGPATAHRAKFSNS